MRAPFVVRHRSLNAKIDYIPWNSRIVIIPLSTHWFLSPLPPWADIFAFPPIVENFVIDFDALRWRFIGCLDKEVTKRVIAIGTASWFIPIFRIVVGTRNHCEQSGFTTSVFACDRYDGVLEFQFKRM